MFLLTLEQAVSTEVHFAFDIEESYLISSANLYLLKIQVQLALDIQKLHMVEKVLSSSFEHLLVNSNMLSDKDCFDCIQIESL